MRLTDASVNGRAWLARPAEPLEKLSIKFRPVGEPDGPQADESKHHYSGHELCDVVHATGAEAAGHVMVLATMHGHRIADASGTVHDIPLSEAAWQQRNGWKLVAAPGLAEERNGDRYGAPGPGDRSGPPAAGDRGGPPTGSNARLRLDKG